MLNYYYKDNIKSFIKRSTEEVIGLITLSNQFDTSQNQNKSWEVQIPILKEAIGNYSGTIFFEFSIPRMGKRIDALIIIRNVVFVIEFKVGENKFQNFSLDQVWDYALDLKNFHEPSHNALIVPILVATEAKNSFIELSTTSHNDLLLMPIKVNKNGIGNAIEKTLAFFSETEQINSKLYASGRYSPTPTIIEAAISLYNKHTVSEITRSDADAKNLTVTTKAISKIIDVTKRTRRKVIVFVTGVPGSGKTLVGLNVATKHLNSEEKISSVYLSGNGPLVNVLQEALARNKIIQSKVKGKDISKWEAKASVKTFIQNIHHYRDAYLIDPRPPYDHVAIFDEAQRAWNRQQTVSFMKQKKKILDFDYSEPEFLISCLDRHKDWATIICLVGGGQEINTGEAGISEWLDAIKQRFSDWDVYISPNLTDSEYSAIEAIEAIRSKSNVYFEQDLHLSVSMRSFRAENLSLLVKCILDINFSLAKDTFSKISGCYPIVLTRDLKKAKKWLREKARGTERYGLVVSSQAQRLKPFAIDVRSPMNPVNWFLNGKDDVRSSYFLEDAATEFKIQGLELDWACVIWDGDLRFENGGWKTFSFVGTKWQNIHKVERQRYLLNAYRVLLTRARQGMVIVIPEGDNSDHTRKPEYYNPTYDYLKSIGIQTI